MESRGCPVSILICCLISGHHQAGGDCTLPVSVVKPVLSFNFRWRAARGEAGGDTGGPDGGAWTIGSLVFNKDYYCSYSK